MLRHKAIKLPAHNDGVKLVQSACNQLMSRDIRSPTHVFVDLPRAMGKEKLGGLFGAIEQIKNGHVYDERNHYEEYWFDSPRVWVFTNDEPDLSWLSADRWRLWEIDEKKELVPYVATGRRKGRAAGKRPGTTPPLPPFRKLDPLDPNVESAEIAEKENGEIIFRQN